MAHSEPMSMKSPLRYGNIENRRDIRELTNVSKNLYINISTFELEASRLYKLGNFQDLIHEIKMFND